MVYIQPNETSDSQLIMKEIQATVFLIVQNLSSTQFQIQYPENASVKFYLNIQIDSGQNLMQLSKFNCDYGFFGKPVFDELGNVVDLECIMCSNDCFECIDLDKCTSCKQGLYLQTVDIQKTYGQCLTKIDQHFEETIYLKPYFPSEEAENINQQIGSYERAFKSLPDAISRAYEIGAKYTSSKVNIILKSKPNLNHAILRQATDFYIPSLYDQYSQSTQISIDTEDRLPQKILYKMRDKWRFKVGGGLSIRNLVFDALDSQLIPDIDTNKCLQNGLINCCGTQSCLEKQYVIHKDQISKLDIFVYRFQNVIFRNFNFNFNSLIELNGSGGHLILDKVTFENINSCGSIIGNKKPILKIQNDLIDTPIKVALQRNSLLQNRYQRIEFYISRFSKTPTNVHLYKRRELATILWEYYQSRKFLGRYQNSRQLILIKLGQILEL
ncbi:UNKNOWN [Stylonychia lemnae]|uniref:Uncharacterized protein n=1 Tax=Stylonychia lemnae TaxID=5949 RepID=A0A078A8P9_STYLE|nr:UNKNOWN [Stylonychia lemnae]|eukprot:CDW78604.1 UNKNOWN [Stylonychia lemnae]